MIKRILSALFIFIGLHAFGAASLVAQTATAPGGSGTAGDPYQIATLNNLYWMYVQTQSDHGYFSGMYFIQTADIDASETATWFSGQGFEPILEFRGTYEGNNKIISNLTIARPSEAYVGLFGLAHACTIQNLGLHAVNLSGLQNVGAIAATAKRATITNCYSTGSISASGTVGGLVGNITIEYNTGSHIRNCFSSCDIIGGGGYSVGGIVGEMEYTLGGSSIENSYSAGNVSGGSGVGGIVGRCNESTLGSIQNCYAIGKVSGSGSSIGGLIGDYVTNPGASVGTPVTNCYWNTDNTATSPVGTGKTTAQLKDQSTFSGWNFTSPWGIDPSKNGGYPYLAWQVFFAPTTQANSIVYSSVTYSGMTINWTRGNGARRAVFVKAGNSGTASPLDNATYAANTAFGSGTQIGTSGWYCIYNGTGSGATITGLTPGTQYIAQVFEYNGIAGGELYLSSSALDNPKVQQTTVLAVPSTQANTITFSSVNTTSFAMGWTKGDGVKRAVFMKAAAGGTASPVDAATYTPNAAFGSGTQIGTSGWYCVYNGTGAGVTISGLTPGTQYAAHVCEYNGNAGQELYLTTSASGNPSAQQTLGTPAVQASDINFSSVAYNAMTINWTNGGGAKRAVFVKQAASGTASPANSTTYTANTVFGSGTQIGSTGWYCVYNGTGSSVSITGLAISKDYTVHVCEYNGNAGEELYLTSSATNDPNTQPTPGIPAVQASNVAFSSITYSGMTINWANGGGAKRAVFMKQAASGTASPASNTTYTANTAFGSGTQIGSTGWFCIYNGTGTSVAVTGLSPALDYTVHVCEYNGDPGQELYSAASATNDPNTQQSAAVALPSTQASNVAFSDVSFSGVTIDWTSGDGEKRAVFIKQAASGTASPANGAAYTANTAFRSGTQIGSTGWYCVYNGTGSSVSISGLSPSQDYTVQVCEYNGPSGNERYLTSGATDNPKSQQTASLAAPSTQAYNVTFPGAGATSVTASWTNGDGSKRVVFAKAGNTGTASPVDNTTYTANATLGSGTQIGTSGWYCVYNGTGTNVTIGGLVPQTEYIVQVIEYNGDAGVELYASAAGSNNPAVQQTNLTDPPASGDGSSGSPYLIASIYNLNWVVQNSGAWSKCFRQTANIDLASSPGFNVIGNGSTNFTGTYDGGGFFISNLSMSRSGSNDQGFFGVVGGSGRIKNLGLVKASVSGNENVGGLAGLVNAGGTITNCFTTGSVSGAYGDVGGLVGEHHGTITGCYSTCNVGAGSNYSSGGLVGYSSSGVVSNSYSTGSVIGSGGGKGGLVGNNTSGTITNCYSLSPQGLVGGFYGGTCTSSYWDNGFAGGSDAGASTSDANMKIQGTFSGWDFATTPIWKIDANNNGYPYLAWQVFAPATQAHDLNTSSDASNSMTIFWTNGNGSKRVVFLKQASSGTTSPVDSTTYTASSVFGSGTQMGSTGWYCVYNGTGSSVTVTGLSSGVMYNAQVFEYNGLAGGEKYNAATASGNPSSNAPMPVEVASFSGAVKEGNVVLNWSTATEINNYGFDIERSVVNAQQSSAQWEKIGFVEGAGNTNAPRQYSFVDDRAPIGSLQYRLKQIDRDGLYKYCSAVASVTLNAADAKKELMPKEFSLLQNYPNPFNPSTTIEYRIAEARFVTLKVYDVLGGEVATLVNEPKAPGTYRVTFDACSKGGRTLSSGVYLYKLTAGSFTSTKQLILLK